MNGRETFLSDVTWHDGWPRIEPHRLEAAPARDGFEIGQGNGFDLRWISPGSVPGSFTRATSDGIKLLAGRNAGEAESRCFLGVRVTDLCWIARADVEGDAGFTQRIDPEHFLAIERVADGVVVRAKVGPFDQILGSATVPSGTPLVLSARPDAAGRRRMLGPDLVSAGVMVSRI